MCYSITWVEKKKLQPKFTESCASSVHDLELFLKSGIGVVMLQCSGFFKSFAHYKVDFLCKFKRWLLNCGEMGKELHINHHVRLPALRLFHENKSQLLQRTISSEVVTLWSLHAPSLTGIRNITKKEQNKGLHKKMAGFIQRENITLLFETF